MKLSTFFIALCFGVIFSNSSFADSPKPAQKRLIPKLLLENNFNDPKEVVNYLVARDQYGFIWSGLLEDERTAFTRWNTSPQSEGVLVSKSYSIQELNTPGANLKSNDSQVKKFSIEYQMTASADASGVLLPPTLPVRRVIVELAKERDGRWRVISPAASDWVPVVSEGFFPAGRFSY